MPEPQPQPANAPERAPDWEAFYRDYRKPGYVPGFEITTKLGGGAFGLVFRARKQSIGKDYAIKFLKVDDGDVRRAVLQELEQVRWFAQVDHPNLVAIEDRGEVDGIPYLVMTFAGTETLRDRLPTDGVPPQGAAKDELLRWFLQCCRGLAALHERSLVHFDVKPANVFLKGAVARLGDYGLSKLVTHSRGSLSMGRGTPYYMAPEMLERRGDHRSDVYSLGVMLYELLCGKVPFTGDSEWAVLKAHETAEPEWPAHLTPVERAVLQRCLQKDPAARYQSVHEVIAAFGAAAGVGAAAWSDVRAGAPAAGPTTPPPLPATLPPPFRPGATPAERVAEDAVRQARRFAQNAVDGARKATRGTTAAVRSTMQELRRRDVDRATRHRRAMAKLREHVRWRRRRPERPAGPRQRSSWAAALAVVGGLTMALGVLGFLFLLAAAPVDVALSPQASVASAPSPALAPSPTRIKIDGSGARALFGPDTSLFTTASWPTTFQDLATTGEPPWVALARRDGAAAAAAIERRIDELRRRVPFEPEGRAEVRRWPEFSSTRPLPQPMVAELVELVRGVLRSPDVDDALVERTIDIGPLALAALAQQLDAIAFVDHGAIEEARRLHATLERATGCREIEFVGEGHIDDIAPLARPLGKLWLWFVHEFARNDRAWRTYRSLRGGG